MVKRSEQDSTYTKSLTTRASNRKGNAKREYFKYKPCDKFHCFSDTRGNDPRNPPCHYGISSKMQVSGPEKSVARGVHYVYRLGRYDYYNVYLDAEKR